jgi:hypothetical protein
VRLLETVQTSARNRSTSACKADRTSPWPVFKMCVRLGVSTPALLPLRRRRTAQQRRQAEIIIHVKTAFQADRGAYGGA